MSGTHYSSVFKQPDKFTFDHEDIVNLLKSLPTPTPTPTPMLNVNNEFTPYELTKINNFIISMEKFLSQVKPKRKLNPKSSNTESDTDTDTESDSDSDSDEESEKTESILQEHGSVIIKRFEINNSNDNTPVEVKYVDKVTIV